MTKVISETVEYLSYFIMDNSIALLHWSKIMGEFEFKTTRFDCTEIYILINHLVSRRLQIINFDLLINFDLIINFYLLIN